MKKIFIMFFIFIFVAIIFSSPQNFPAGEVIVVDKGLTDMQVSLALANKDAIRPAELPYLTSKVLGVSHQLKAGRYVFSTSTNMFEVLERVKNGDYGTKTKKITIPEGYTNKQIGDLIGTQMDDTEQGFLFPDTYYIDEFASIDDIREILHSNFLTQVGTVATDTVILASILEEEVQTQEDMELVAGILLKRLKVGMPLQVDAYPDTYKNRGLPPAPISNPGLKSINSARNPKTSKYWYYLSGKDGKTHYAKTFEEHKANKMKYL